MKKIFFWVILFILGITLPLLFLEVGGRVYIALTHGVEGKSYGLWRYDEQIGAVHRENAYNSNATTNDFGFRNSEPVFNPKPAKSRRLIAYGGSTTFCYNLLNGQAWPLQLQKLLRNQSQAITNGVESNPIAPIDSSQDQVLNGGAILWSIGHAYARAQRDIPNLKPDYVIIYSGINEETNESFLSLAGTPLEDYVNNQEYGKFATNLDQNRWAKRNLFVVRLFDYLIKPLIEPSDETKSVATTENKPSSSKPNENETLPIPAVEENYRQTLIAFLELIKQNDAQAIFVAQAYGIDTPRNRRFIAYSQRAVDLASAHGAIIVNAQNMVDSYEGPSEELFSSSGVHYSELGASKLAKYIYDSVFAATAQ